MSALTSVDGTATIGTTNYSLVTESTTPVGTSSQSRLRLLDVWIDFSAVAVGGVDEYRVDVYDIVGDDITPSLMASWPVITPGVFEIKGLLAFNYTDVLVTKVTGTDRSIRYSLRETKHPDDGTWFEVAADAGVTTEHSIPAAGAPAAQTDDAIIQLFMHTYAASGASRWRVRVYEKIDAGTQRTRCEWYVGDDEALVSPLIRVQDGWDVTIEKLSGSTIDVEYSLRKFIPPLAGGGGSFTPPRLGSWSIR